MFQNGNIKFYFMFKIYRSLELIKIESTTEKFFLERLNTERFMSIIIKYLLEGFPSKDVLKGKSTSQEIC